MFKNRKLEVRLVKDVVPTNVTEPEESKPALDAYDYALITEEAATRLMKKLVISGIVTIVSIAVVAVVAHAADTSLQVSITE